MFEITSIRSSARTRMYEWVDVYKRQGENNSLNLQLRIKSLLHQIDCMNQLTKSLQEMCIRDRLSMDSLVHPCTSAATYRSDFKHTLSYCVDSFGMYMYAWFRTIANKRNHIVEAVSYTHLKVSKPVKPKSNHAADAVMIDINKVEPNSCLLYTSRCV